MQVGGDTVFASIQSMGFWGLNAFPVEVETDITPGLPGFDVVGLPDTAIKESRDPVSYTHLAAKRRWTA